MRKGSLEINKIVIWVVCALVALVVLYFMVSQLTPKSGLMKTVLEKLLG